MSEAVQIVGIDIQLGIGTDSHGAEISFRQSNFTAAADHDIGRTDGVGVSLIAVEGQSTGVAHIGSDGYVAGSDIAVDAHIGRTIEQDVTAQAPLVASDNDAVGIHAEAVGIGQFQDTGVDFNIDCVAAVDCQIAGVEFGGISVGRADHTAFVVDNDFNIGGVAAEQGVDRAVGDIH